VTVGDTVRLPAAFFQPMAAADVARGLATAAAGEPANGIVEDWILEAAARA